MTNRERFLKILRTIFGLFLLLSLFIWVPTDELAAVLKNINPATFIMAFILSLIGMLISALKLHQILITSGHKNFLRELCEIYFIAHFFNNFVPTSIGGDFIKILQIHKRLSLPVSKSTTAVFLERFTGIMILIFIGFIFCIFSPDLYAAMGLGIIGTGKFWSIMAIIVVIIASIFSYFLKKNYSFEKKSKGLLNYLKKILHFPNLTKKIMFSVISLSLFFHLNNAAIYIFISRSISSNLLYTHALALLPVIALVSFLPISMGGIGLREGIITFCLQGIGYPLEIGFAIAISLRLFSLFNSIIGGIIYSFTSNE
jgi:hypothetical protein